MTLRIRFPQGSLIHRHRENRKDLVQAATQLITPMCVMAYVLAFWRLAADAGVAAESGVRGLFSHWQLWIVAGLALQVAGKAMQRRMAQGPVVDTTDPDQATKYRTESSSHSRFA